MKKINILLSALTIALATSAYADLAQPGELVPDILDKPIVINGETMHVVRTIDKNILDIKVINKDAKEIWRSIALGMQAWNFKIDGKVTSLETKDIDGDKIPEIITACTTGDVQTALYIFKYNPEKKNFGALNFGYQGYDLKRDFMVSDIPAENGENMVFESDTTIKTLGKIYTEAGAVPGFYYFEYKNGEFTCTKQVAAQVKEK